MKLRHHTPIAPQAPTAAYNRGDATQATIVATGAVNTWPTSPRPSVEEILRAVRITSLTRELDLSYARGLTPRTLKALFSCLPNLRKLTMRYTDLTRLPDAFEVLPELRELDLSFNGFTFLPPSIGSLSRLQHLSIMGNRLEYLPKTFGRLGALRFFNASSNKLQALGPEIGHLQSLRVLRLASNRLSELHADVGTLAHLQLLQLSFNRLRRLPPQLGKVTELKVLNLAFNALVALPDALGDLQELVHLDVTGNDIAALPTTLAQMDNLRVRGLQHQVPAGAGSDTQVTAGAPAKPSFLWSDAGAARTRELQWRATAAPLSRNAVTTINGLAEADALRDGGAGQNASQETSAQVAYRDGPPRKI
jgi:Leucine-rich repeat (LRR) protein